MDGRTVDTDIKPIFVGKTAHMHEKCASTAPTQGSTVRMAIAGHVDIKSTINARDMMRPTTKIAHMRAVMGRSSKSMSSILDTAKNNGPSSVLVWLLGECGPDNRELCPLCFDIKEGTGQRDGRTHMRHECTHPTIKSMRGLLETWKAERVVRSGPPGHARGDFALQEEHVNFPYAGWSVLGGRQQQQAVGLVRAESKDGLVATFSSWRASALKKLWIDQPGVPEISAEVMVKIVRHAVLSFKSGSGLESLPVDFPPSLVAFLQLHLKLTTHFCTSPLCVTSGIFPETPTFLTGTCPLGMAANLGWPEENGDFLWSRDVWMQSGMVAIRAGDQKIKESRVATREFIKRLLDKIWRSADGGVTILLLVERPPVCKGDDEQLSLNAPKRRGESGLRACHLLTIPAGRIPSSTCREWAVDLDGNVHATKHDGAGTGEARELARGYNEFPVQTWV